MYKPLNIQFKFTEPINFQHQITKKFIGVFNSHSLGWGYADTNEDDERIDKWADECQMQLMTQNYQALLTVSDEGMNRTRIIFLLVKISSRYTQNE